MNIANPRLIAGSLAVAVAAGALSIGVPRLAKPELAQASDTTSKTSPDGGVPGRVSDRTVHVDAPRTTVDVRKDTGKVRVAAPYTNVKVDPARGQVRVRAPYVDLNIRW